jgi:hypothetical protein
MDGRINRWSNKQMDGWTNEYHGKRNRWLNIQTDGWMESKTDKRKIYSDGWSAI